MFIAKVIGNVVSTIKNPKLEGFKLMLIKQLDIDGNLIGKPMVAIDSIDSGIGDKVLVLKEGGSAKIVLKRERMPVNLVIVGVIDKIELTNWKK